MWRWTLIGVLLAASLVPLAGCGTTPPAADAASLAASLTAALSSGDEAAFSSSFAEAPASRFLASRLWTNLTQFTVTITGEDAELRVSTSAPGDSEPAVDVLTAQWAAGRDDRPLLASLGAAPGSRVPLWLSDDLRVVRAVGCTLIVPRASTRDLASTCVAASRRVQAAGLARLSPTWTRTLVVEVVAHALDRRWLPAALESPQTLERSLDQALSNKVGRVDVYQLITPLRALLAHDFSAGRTEDALLDALDHLWNAAPEAFVRANTDQTCLFREALPLRPEQLGRLTTCGDDAQLVLDGLLPALAPVGRPDDGRTIGMVELDPALLDTRWLVWASVGGNVLDQMVRAAVGQPMDEPLLRRLLEPLPSLLDPACEARSTLESAIAALDPGRLLRVDLSAAELPLTDAVIGSLLLTAEPRKKP